MKQYTPSTAKKLHALQQANYQSSNSIPLKIKNSRSGLRKFCIDCAETPTDATTCKVTYCAFYPYRVGKAPTKKDMATFNKALQLDELNHSPSKLRYHETQFVFIPRKYTDEHIANLRSTLKKHRRNATSEKNEAQPMVKGTHAS